jgi:pyruvate dehydrogenase E1 component alpha subunit
MLEMMALIRCFDEQAGELWVAGEIRGSVHQYIGQEAIAVGVCASLGRKDYITSYHRGHGHCLAKGADADAMMQELLGRQGGICGGKGGSMHIADFGLGILGANGVVGDGVTLALGAAHSVRLRQEARIVATFFGDGAINRGPVLEALNWAAVYRLPILFVCEDNQYSATTSTRAVTAPAGIGARVAGFGIPYEAVDGNDLLAVKEVAERLSSRVRSGDGPSFLHARTYRARGHLAHDKAAYRPAGEAEAAWREEPIARFRARLRDQGVPNSAIEAALERARRRVDIAVATARSASPPKIGAAFTDVQDLGSPDEWL